MKRLWTLSLLALLLAAGLASAQSTTGTIQVIVTSQDGQPLPGATVSAESEESLFKGTAFTGNDGVATMAGLKPSAKYVVTTGLDGFNGARNENVLVRSGQITSLRVQLALSSVTEELLVTSETPIVDVTSAVTGQDITLQLTESLPTGRSYQNYLQLVPGVLPTDPTVSGENPASRSGLNYRDIGGENGVSRDNFYYLEGINVTDPVQGTFGANLNTEIIQEQSVLTGGVPAEFIGASGLISNVITKSGGNRFSGSLNYFFQDDGLVADNKNAGDASFSTFDTAITLGGPIKRDRAWFFGSFRQLERDDDVISLDTNEFLRSVTNEQDQGFGKISWALTNSDRLTGTFLNDPTDISGRIDRDLTNARDQSRQQGGDRLKIDYQHIWKSLALDLGYAEHNGEVSQFSVIREARNNVGFRGGDSRTLADEQLGGQGEDVIDERDVELTKGVLEWFKDSSFGSHSVKLGVELQDNINFRDRFFIGQARYESLALRYLNDGVDARSLSEDVWTEQTFDVFNTSDWGGFLTGLAQSANFAAHMDILDSNGDGVLTQEEAASAIVFNSTLGNPNGRINYTRFFQTQDGAQETMSEGTTYFVQDTWQHDRWSVNLGLRAERWEHFATTGEGIFTFDWEYAPRVSIVYDLKGNGRQKVSGFYGRYYDPIRNNMTNFAGSISGRVREEQVFFNGEWITYRVRGGAQQQDALFAPTTQTPYTDEFTVGYQIDLGRSMSLEATVIKRETRDILEDYDLALYALATDGTTLYPGPIDDPNTLWLGLDYFGYDVNPGSNFVIATLAGAARDWDGFEVVFRKRYSNHWQLLTSLTLADAQGSSNSDSNADFQGDVLFLDPRAPNQFADQPGSIEQLFKAAGSYHFDNGITLGASYRWNSGTLASRTFFASRRNLPVRVPAGEEFQFAGFDHRWLSPDAVGSLENPSWASLDLRVQYNRRFLDAFDAEFFVDIFNVFDDQATVRNQDLVAGQGSSLFGDGIQFVPPRRFFLGARIGF